MLNKWTLQRISNKKRLKTLDQLEVSPIMNATNTNNFTFVLNSNPIYRNGHIIFQMNEITSKPWHLWLDREPVWMWRDCWQHLKCSSITSALSVCMRSKINVMRADQSYFWLSNALKWLTMQTACLISQNMLEIFLEINILSTRFDSDAMMVPDVILVTENLTFAFWTQNRHPKRAQCLIY